MQTKETKIGVLK